MQRGNKECNWIEFTPGIVCEAAAGSGHFWIILKIKLIAQIVALHNWCIILLLYIPPVIYFIYFCYIFFSYNWCFILLPSPVMAETGADEDKHQSAEIYNSNYKP